MGLETGVNYINDLVSGNPTGTDPKGQGDDHIRNNKRAAKQTFPGFLGAVVATGPESGAANAYVLTPATPLVSYVDGMAVRFTPSNANTGASTINISGLGAKALKAVGGAALMTGELSTGCWYQAVYDADGDVFLLDAVTKTYAEQLAFSASLPGQTGNSGKYLTTDGATASWAVVFPSFTGTVGRSLRSTGSIAAWEWTGLSGAYSVTTAVTVQLDNDVAPIVRVTPTAAAVSVELPDATSLTQRGREYLISNAGNYPLGVRDYDGTLLSVVPPLCSAFVVVVDVSTAAGVWNVNNPDEMGTLTWPTASLITETIAGGVVSMSTLATDKAIVAWSTATGIRAAVLSRSGATLTLGTPITVHGIANPQTPQVAALSATGAVLVYMVDGGDTIYSAAVSISGTTVTAGSPVVVTSGAEYNGATSAMALDSSRAVLGWSAAVGGAGSIAVVSVSGLAITAGTAVSVNATSGAPIFAPLGSGAFLTRDDGGFYACSTSVTTITKGSIFAITNSRCAVAASSTGKVVAIFNQPNNVVDVTVTISASGSTISDVSRLARQNMTTGSSVPRLQRWGSSYISWDNFGPRYVAKTANDALYAERPVVAVDDLSIANLFLPFRTLVSLDGAVGAFCMVGATTLVGGVIEVIK